MAKAKLNNPAGRLVRHMEKAVEVGQRDRGQILALRGWSLVFDVQEDDAPLTIRRLGELFGLFHESRSAIMKLDIDHEHYLAWIEPVSKPFLEIGLNQPIRSFLSGFNGQSRGLMNICADQLSKAGLEPLVDEGKIESLRLQLSNVREDITEAEITDELRVYLLRHLEIIDRALNDYLLHGYRALDYGLESSVGHEVLNRQVVYVHKSSKWRDAVLGLLGAYVLLMDVPYAHQPLLDDIREILPDFVQAEETDDPPTTVIDGEDSP